MHEPPTFIVYLPIYIYVLYMFHIFVNIYICFMHYAILFAIWNL